MPQRLHARRRLVVAATVVAWFALSPVGAKLALAQAGRFAAEITKIEMAERRVTLKASMGQQTLRVVPGVALDAVRPGDKVLLTFGVEGTESVITGIEVVKS